MLLAPGVAAQGTGTIRGVVLEYGTRRPVSGAEVMVVDTRVAVMTDAQGRYQVSAPAGREVILRAHRPGYASVIEQVRPIADAVLVVDFTLAARAEVLSALNVEGRDTAVVPASSLGEVLDGVSGVQLIRSSGDVGRGYSLRIRGVKSFSFAATPVIFVDGVRVDVLGTRGGSGILELLDANAIGRVEVLRGPAASARYGTGAMNGVILITTKRGPP